MQRQIQICRRDAGATFKPKATARVPTRMARGHQECAPGTACRAPTKKKRRRGLAAGGGGEIGGLEVDGVEGRFLQLVNGGAIARLSVDEIAQNF